jgi:glycosyltransferase involved in cell wall biosynthesis
MDIVIIANAWSAGINNPTSKHRIAVEAARQGHRILWIVGAGMRSPSALSRRDRTTIIRKIKEYFAGPLQVFPGIHVVTPLPIPFPSYGIVRRFNGFIYQSMALSISRRLGFSNPVLINYVPVLAEAMNSWPGSKVYHCVDRWDAFDIYDSVLMASMNDRCCKLADVVIASSKELVSYCSNASGNVHYLPHGVDYSHFATALNVTTRPVDLPDGPIIGYFGLLSEWVDQDLLLDIADQCQSATLVLIGAADVSIERLEAHPRIRCLGPRNFNDLPSYVAFFSVGIIPFHLNDLTRAVNPIKLREMISAGSPVVSVQLPEVMDYTSAVRCVRREDFVQEVLKITENPVDQQTRKTISASIKHESWEYRLVELIALIEQG